tara:strand:- start:33 stop:371 length:339 start_codon:yes stop_codon:yes gene_type:complete
MKLTKQMLHELIIEALREGGDRPWKSDHDREGKAKECEDGNVEACDELDTDENEWKQMLDRWVGGDDGEPMSIPGTTQPPPEMPFRDAGMKRAVDAVNKPPKKRKSGKWRKR